MRKNGARQQREKAISGWGVISTRKLCYRKDDRAMRPIHGALKIFGTP